MKPEDVLLIVENILDEQSSLDVDLKSQISAHSSVIEDNKRYALFILCLAALFIFFLK